MAKVKIRGKVKDGVASIKSLMPHPMETGTRRDADGVMIAAHYIESVHCEINGETVMKAQWGPSVSKDPYFAFKIKGAASGDTVKVSWVDNKGESSSGEMVLK
jgi:sulfur-oxidizing protein SoxZ